MVYGTYAAYQVVSPATKHFGGSLYNIPALDQMGYIAMTAFVLNVVVAVVLSVVLNAAHVFNGADETTPGDYFADAGDPRVEKNIEQLGEGEPA
jgi:SSS family solute:Na+ symporter